ncbi:hypothetical protein BJV82DRAFT_611089 [Fennellomyces sp. T-0311]|nr:hypothetical protein BJV82DRAFT_611089 [Fennellomyces sp. T-0311]
MTPAPTMAGTQSIADLTTKLHSTSGDVPPSLIGASTTIVGDRLFLFGGRLQASAQVLNRVYVLSLTTHMWTQLVPRNEPPPPRYFHSANLYQPKKKSKRIIFYGGLTVNTAEDNGLCSLGDLFFLVLDDDNGPYWEYPNPESRPHERYSHLTTMTNNQRHLVVLGGQDVNAGYIDEINIYDCRQNKWRDPYPVTAHYCTYRTAAATVTPISPSISVPSRNFSGILGNPFFHTGGAQEESQDLEDVVHRQKMHSTIFAYSNYNFYDLKRTLQQITISNKGHVVDVTDHTAALIGSRQYTPPALRFPAGFACGHFLIVVGPCITPESQQLHIWALNVVSMTWTRIDAGPALSRGSWLKGLLHEDRNQFVVFGHPGRSMQDDHTQRVIHFEYSASIDTEAFGIYQPPYLTYGPTAQEAGLALLSNPMLSDITLISTDGYRVRANSMILAQRWPSVHSRLCPLVSPTTKGLSTSVEYTLTFPDTQDILVAFLQFLYTDHLTTVEQNQPRILTRLLLLADLFGLNRLKALAVHSLHQMLQISTAPDIYQTAAMADCTSLQIRALRVMVNAKKMIQQQHSQSQQSQQRSQQTQQQQQQTLIDRIGSSSQNHHQPLSKLLRQYDISNVPMPNSKVQLPGNNAHFPANHSPANNGGIDLSAFPLPPNPPSTHPHSTAPQRSNTAPPLRAKNPSRKSSNSTTASPGVTSAAKLPSPPPSVSQTGTQPTKLSRNNTTLWLPMTF